MSDTQDEKKWQLLIIKEWIMLNNKKPPLNQLKGQKSEVLQKRSSKNPTTWHARHFVLQGNFLFYYDGSDDAAVFKGVLLLKDCTVTAMKFFESMSNVIIIQPRYPYSLLKNNQPKFHARLLQKKYYISCPTGSAMEQWHKAIERARKLYSISDPSAPIPGLAVDPHNEKALLRAPSIQDVVSTYPMAAVSFGGHAITDQSDIVAGRVLKKLEKLEALAQEFGPFV